MSILKQISLMVMGLSMSFVFACAPKQIRLETGEEMAEQATQVMETETEQKVQKVDSKSLIYVYVCGMVKNPGVYWKSLPCAGQKRWSGSAEQGRAPRTKSVIGSADPIFTLLRPRV
jgi:hypothetical protein